MLLNYLISIHIQATAVPIHYADWNTQNFPGLMNALSFHSEKKTPRNLLVRIQLQGEYSASLSLCIPVPHGSVFNKLIRPSWRKFMILPIYIL